MIFAETITVNGEGVPSRQTDLMEFLGGESDDESEDDGDGDHERALDQARNWMLCEPDDEVQIRLDPRDRSGTLSIRTRKNVIKHLVDMAALQQSGKCPSNPRIMIYF
jgi:hypothetical protein